MKRTSIDNKYLEMWVESGIVYCVYKPNLVIDLKVAMEMVKDRLRVSEGIIRPVFIDISNLVSIDLDAREYLSGGDAVKLISAGAIYSKSPISKFAGKLFLDINQPEVPTNIFSDKDEAIQWLQQFNR